MTEQSVETVQRSPILGAHPVANRMTSPTSHTTRASRENPSVGLLAGSRGNVGAIHSGAPYAATKPTRKNKETDRRAMGACASCPLALSSGPCADAKGRSESSHLSLTRRRQNST